MHTVHCTMQCRSVQSILCIVQFTLYKHSVECILYTVHYALYTVQLTMYNTVYSVYTVRLTVYSVQCREVAAAGDIRYLCGADARRGRRRGEEKIK